ncbi:MAG: helix-turn-helix transcriptional regulator [Proteobacteria bacterium]|nr:helix-turn-helix transcriptional regulator [Pseudomonadota bacterium]
MIDYRPSLDEQLSSLGERARQLRLLRRLGQAELAERAGVGLATVARFEKSGTASIENVLRIATALHADAAFDQLFAAPAFASLDDALARPFVASRKRAPRRT